MFAGWARDLGPGAGSKPCQLSYLSAFNSSVHFDRHADDAVSRVRNSFTAANYDYDFDFDFELSNLDHIFLRRSGGFTSNMAIPSLDHAILIRRGTRAEIVVLNKPSSIE